MGETQAVVRSINGERLRLTGEFAFAEPVGEEWERPVYDRFCDATLPGMTVFDVGASFGLYAIAAARAVGPAGRVFAFEAAPRTAEALRRHLAWNGVADRVEVVEAAVADRTAEAPFWEHETSFLASLTEESFRQEERRFAGPAAPRKVATIALGDFCERRGLDPDVVKIDVEGAEDRVLAGARPLLERGKAVFFVEVHEAFATPADALADLRAAAWHCDELHTEPAGTRHYLCRPPTA